jgi:asparagine synthase (glutamine-hydrolysing)
MCGIAGVLGDRAHDVGRIALLESCGRMRHRGPDGDAVWSSDGKYALAHTRLAIIDVAGGAQPMFTDDERYVVVFNGEIYNYRELRLELEGRGRRFGTRSDTEVLLHLYAELGSAMVDRLRGMFAFAVIDRQEGRALLARDRFGKKPLCYSESGGGLVFASTLDALRPLLPSKPDVDPEAIAQYLVLQYVPAPLTAWSGVRKLQPGHLAEWRDGRLEVRSYWSAPQREVDGSAPSVDEAAGRLRELIGEAVSIRLESEVPLGVFLSGGIDSSIVVAELAATGTPPATYSVGFKHASFDESGYARLVADRFGTQHHQLVADDDPPALFLELVQAYDEPFADSSALATLAVARAASQHVTVILTGDGGDELFGGYSRYGYLRRAQRIHDRLGPFAKVSGHAAEAAGRVVGNRRLAGGGRWIRDPWAGYRDGLFHFLPKEIESLLRPELLEHARPDAPVERLNTLWGRAPGRPTTPLWVDEQTYLPDDLLVKMDRAAMAHSLEARSPLLDHVLAEYAATIPGPLLFDGAGNGKAIVRRAYRDVLPAEVLTRPKMGFGVPLAAWLRKELRPLAEELLLSKAGPLHHWLRPEAVGSFVRAFLAGDDGPKWRVWNLLALAGWASARSE